MRTADFVRWAEGVYGEYRPLMKVEVELWLGSHDEYFLAALREICLRDHPSVYKVPPGVHELDAMKVEAYQRGHTLEAIHRAKSGQAQISSNADYVVTEEDIERNAQTVREWIEAHR